MATSEAPAVQTDAQKLAALRTEFEGWRDRVMKGEAADRAHAGRMVTQIDQAQAMRSMTRGGGSINSMEDAFRSRENWMRLAAKSSRDDGGSDPRARFRAQYGNAFKTGW